MASLFGKLEDIAIERLKAFEDNALMKRPEGYYVAYSGGKDSDVILDLVRRSGVKYTAHHHLTTCDPPEVVRHVKEQSDVIIKRPELTMWQLIRKHKMLPRRNTRYCCGDLKEGGGLNSMVVTGVRWGESAKRSKRKMIETCFQHKTKRFLNIIIEWSTADVWNYIRHRNISYCKLYDEGFKRLGCILCPMSRDTQRQMERWPEICRGWKRAALAIFDPSKDGFKSGEEYWQWWLDRDAPSLKKDKDQMMFFSD